MTKKSHEDFLKEVKEKHGDSYIVLNKYSGYNNMVEVIHKCGRKQKIKARYLIEKGRKNKCECEDIVPYEIVVEKLRKKGFEIIGEYKDSITNVEIMHTCGEIYNEKPNNFLKVTRKCEKCKIKNRNKLQEDLTGKKFNMLKVLRMAKNDEIPENKKNRKERLWLCECDCKNKKVYSTRELNNKLTISCGCYSIRNFVKRNTKHNMKNTRFYRIWYGMKRRCDDKNNRSYKSYGGRGITYCDKWSNFIGFKEDMYDSYLKHANKYGEKNTTIERIDVNGNYDKSNCRWATIKEQNNNKRNNVKFKAISPHGDVIISENYSDFAKKYNLNKTAIYFCLTGKNLTHKGWMFKRVDSSE